MSRPRRIRTRLAAQSSAQPYMRSTSEPTPELLPFITQGQAAQPGQYERMIAGWPAVARHVTDLRITLGAAQYWWQPVQNERIEEARFREDLESITENMYVDAENDIQGFGSVAETWADFWLQGFYGAELRLVDCASSVRNYHVLTGKAVEAYPIHASTISVFEQDDQYRRLLGIRQQSSTGGAMIPIERLIWAQRGGRIGDYSGMSVLRPLLFPFQRWLSIWLSREQAAAMQGGCIIAVPERNAGGDDEWNAVRTTLNRWQNQQARYVIARPGWDFRFEAPAASVGGDEIDKLDSYVDRVLGGQVQALIDSATGHRALGEVVAADQAARSAEDFTAFLRRWGTRFAKWLAEQVAYGGRLPTLCIKTEDKQASPADEIATLAAAKSAGLLEATPADLDHVRRRLGLPEPEPAIVEMDEGAATEAVATATTTLQPPRAAQEAVADALVARSSTPSAERGLVEPFWLALAKRIADGAAIERREAQVLAAWFRQAGRPDADPTWQTRGRAYQDWQGRGGMGMMQWLAEALADTPPVAA